MGHSRACAAAFAACVACLLSSIAAAQDPQPCAVTGPGRPVEAVVLRVALYPFTPDRQVIFHKLEAAFECAHPGVNVELVADPNATADYYRDDEAARRGFRFVDADVYEIDTILLADFIARGKIAPLDLPHTDFAPEAVAAVVRDGRTWAVPHWLCGNFLFYRKSDTGIREARDWKQLLDLLASRGQYLLADFRGRSTLGEWYLTALAATIGLDAAQQRIVAGAPLEPVAIDYLRDILAACPSGYCRNAAMHEKTGFYARTFVRGQAAAYIGYSETMHYGLRELADNCPPGSGCLAEADIGVRALPRFDMAKAEQGVGWVDALAIDAGLSGRRKDLALAFVNLAVSERSYRAMLTPEPPYRSRYLLPARAGIAISDAPLLAQFAHAQAGRGTGMLPDLNRTLRERAAKVTCALPIDNDDIATRQACGQP